MSETEKRRCPTRFERKPKGLRYVTARWQCPRFCLKGLPYCSYCEGYSRKQERLAANRASP
jgi:hypothetical protein